MTRLNEVEFERYMTSNLRPTSRGPSSLLSAQTFLAKATSNCINRLIVQKKACGALAVSPLCTSIDVFIDHSLPGGHTLDPGIAIAVLALGTPCDRKDYTEFA